MQNNGNLPAVVDRPIQFIAQPVQTSGLQAQAIPMDGMQQVVPLSHYLWILRRHRWQISGFITACVLATLIVSVRLTPVYEATATIDVDRQSPPGIIGQEANRAALNDADQFLATQVKLLQSDSVLRPVVQKFNLLQHEGALNTQNPSQAAARQDAPITLKKLRVTRPPNTYLLLVSYRSPDARLASDTANAVAQSYIQHTFNLRFKASSSLSSFMEKQLEELKAKMEGSTLALGQFEKELNVINPEEKTSILSARLLQLNTEYTNAQSDRVRKEAASTSLGTGSMESALASPQGESLRKLLEGHNDAQQKFAAIRGQYGANHPEYRKAAGQVVEIQRLLDKTRQTIAQRVAVEYAEAQNREQILKNTVAETKVEFDKLNARSFEYQQLKREAEADKTLYGELVRRIKEAGINASFQNSSIRLADAARPAVKPVFPNVPLNVSLALLFSSLLGVAAAVLADVLDNTVRNPEEISRSLNTQVIGTLPSVKSWRRHLTPISLAGESNALTKLDNGIDEPASGFAESIRTLRNSILLADFDHRLKTILVTSASPAEGKSTTAAYLASSYAQQGKKTLIIDGDLRRPTLHRRFDLPNVIGLSDILLGETTWRAAVLPVRGADNLDVLPAGPPSRRAADIVGSQIGELLDELSRQYDIVVLDAPPLLGFAEPLQMSTGVDGVLVVARAGETSRKSLASVVSTLNRLRANVIGLVLNEVRGGTHDGYYYGYSGYYGAYHTSEERSKPLKCADRQ